LELLTCNRDPGCGFRRVRGRGSWSKRTPIFRLDRKVRTLPLAGRDGLLWRSNWRAKSHACPLPLANEPSKRLPAGYIRSADSGRDRERVDDRAEPEAHDEELATRRHKTDPALEPVLPTSCRRGRTGEPRRDRLRVETRPQRARPHGVLSPGCSRALHGRFLVVSRRPRKPRSPKSALRSPGSDGYAFSRCGRNQASSKRFTPAARLERAPSAPSLRSRCWRVFSGPLRSPTA
jgi:hypothetical protein